MDEDDEVMDLGTSVCSCFGLCQVVDEGEGSVGLEQGLSVVAAASGARAFGARSLL